MRKGERKHSAPFPGSLNPGESFDRTPNGGRPYYCIKCGAGFGEFIACEMPDCQLETEATAQQRHQEVLGRSP